MINNSVYCLNNYDLNKREVGLCLITGTSAPYAKRHWELSNKNPRYSMWHKVMAAIEYTPVIGGLVGLIERIIVSVSSRFRPSSENFEDKDPLIGEQRQSPRLVTKTLPSSMTQTRGNATASEFISSANKKLFDGITKLTEPEAQEFLNRGGTLNIITEGKINENRIMIRKEEQVITGCTSGINRSQVAAAILLNEKITVKGVLAGGDSAMNPEADFPIFANPCDDELAATNFKDTFGRPKLSQIGAEKFKSTVDTREVINAKKFYQDYIDRLSPTHFITFGLSGPSVIRRLLLREGSLIGFTITHCPWVDEIAHPPKDSELEKYSTGAYERFATNLSACLSIA